mmetsp:Transcript_13692/g.32440  ORF Transcript_13692/g.32440 Transcript_13692/m.32440 type:complete len:92 (+) Transcript_13692:1331-1606(+)
MQEQGRFVNGSCQGQLALQAGGYCLYARTTSGPFQSDHHLLVPAPELHTVVLKVVSSEPGICNFLSYAMRLVSVSILSSQIFHSAKIKIST